MGAENSTKRISLKKAYSPSGEEEKKRNASGPGKRYRGGYGLSFSSPYLRDDKG